MAITNPNFLYILTGNLSLIPGFEDQLQNKEVAEKMSKFFRKDPHDLIIPNYFGYELNRIKDDDKKRPELRLGAQEALRSMDGFLREFHLSGENLLMSGQPVDLPNGARVYFTDIKKDRLYEMHPYATPLTPDMIIALCVKDYFDQNSNYAKKRFITDDVGCSEYARQIGLMTESFRFENVKNPLQQYRGIVTKDVNYKEMQKLLAGKREEISLKDNGIFDINDVTFSPNQIVEFKQQKRTGENISHFMIYVPDRKVLRRAKHYEEFLDFMTNHLSEKRSQVTSHDRKLYTKDLLMEYISQLKSKGMMTDGQFSEYQRRVNQADGSKKSNKQKEQKLKKLYNHIARDFEGKAVQSHTQKGMIELPFNSEFKPLGEQIPYLDHLLNPEIKALTVDAKGGFGKTLWGLAAALYLVHKGDFKKALYMKSMSSVEQDVAAVPGDRNMKIAEKIRPGKEALYELFENPRLGAGGYTQVESFIERLVSQKLLEFDVISDTMGRTFRHTYIVVDDAHVFNRDQLGLLMGRVHHTSKFVALSGMEQLRSSTKRYVNEWNSGISHAAEKLHDLPYCAHLSASKWQIYRGPVPEAAERLTDRARDLIR